MFRLSVKQDYPDLCGLWLEAFGEGEESAKFVFEGFSGYQHIYVLEEERAVVCMAWRGALLPPGKGRNLPLRGRHKKISPRKRSDVGIIGIC